jgi:hypothetical protein
MKQILGDNQFFGINHFDLKKGEKVKNVFDSDEKIISFIKDAIKIGLDGFMINSNDRGYRIVNQLGGFNTEVHYSIPYPHKFATMVNENGMMSLLKYVIKQARWSSLLFYSPKFLLTRNVRDILSLVIDLEIPKRIPKGSYIYLQNIVTDLIIGLKRPDLFEEYCRVILSKGFRPAIITLNPLVLDKYLTNLPKKYLDNLIICYNINISGFNVFPGRKEVESFSRKKHAYKLMGMSILSSGGYVNIEESIKYVASLNLDYVVYGSSNLKNIESNYKLLCSYR